MLESDSYDFEVRVEEEEAMIMDVEAIPLYFLNISEEQLIVPGAFEKEDFKIALIDLMNGEIESKSYI
jgi:predicted DsbA family dithiol-disulfide isomerase